MNNGASAAKRPSADIGEQRIAGSEHGNAQPVRFTQCRGFRAVLGGPCPD